MIMSMRLSGACTTASSRIGSCSSLLPSDTDCQGSPSIRSPLCPAITPAPPTTLWMVLVPAPNRSGATVEKKYWQLIHCATTSGAVRIVSRAEPSGSTSAT